MRAIVGARCGTMSRNVRGPRLHNNPKSDKGMEWNGSAMSYSNFERKYKLWNLRTVWNRFWGYTLLWIVAPFALPEDEVTKSSSRWIGHIHSPSENIHWMSFKMWDLWEWGIFVLSGSSSSFRQWSKKPAVFLVLSEVGFSRVASLDFQRVSGNGFLGRLCVFRMVFLD